MKKEFTLRELMTAYAILSQVATNGVSAELRSKILGIRVKYKRAIKQYEEEKDLAGKEATSDELKSLAEREQELNASDKEKFEKMKAEFEKTMSTFINSKINGAMDFERERFTVEEYEELKRSEQPKPYESVNAYGRGMMVNPSDAIEELYFYFVE
ncbi:MAG: hypothetical protein GY755_13420 [Chloroflexi bacterium]|nr:hypothetical protein [Chloroflexota bacterium]